MVQNSARHRRAVVAVAVVALLAVAVTTEAAAAATTRRVGRAAESQRILRDRGGARVGVVVAAATTPARRRAVRTYWTRQRMLSARPVPLRVGPARPTVAGTAAATTGRRVGRDRAADDAVRRASPSRAAVVTGLTWPYAASAAARTTGKVFFSMPDGDYVCSGSAVASADASTVLTAGHCVLDGGTTVTATNWVFVPGYRDGLAPYGEFPATHLATTTGWRTSGDFDADVAFANVGTNGAGLTLTTAVGGQQIGFGHARSGRATALGYPAQSPFAGERLTFCRGPLVDDTVGNPPTADLGLACAMTGGSSGGPWLADYDAAAGRGTVVAVTSFYYPDHPGWLYGAYLDAAARTVFDAVAATTGD